MHTSYDMILLWKYIFNYVHIQVSFDSNYCDKDHYYLVQLDPDVSLYEICEADRLPGLYYFCQQLRSRKAKERLIIQLE